MYALTYKKSLTSRLMSLTFKYKWFVLLLALGLYQFSSGIYIFAKAELAQYLIKDAWQTKLQTGVQKPPWPWADTHPVAELIIKNKHWFVLAGASGRNLAFAPTHVSATSLPGDLGNSVIVGHRDTHFSILNELQSGDIIEVKTLNKRQRYQISQLRIAHQSQVEYLQNGWPDNNAAEAQATLTLITCYPFDSVLPNPTHRYIVRAVAI